MSAGVTVRLSVVLGLGLHIGACMSVPVQRIPSAELQSEWSARALPEGPSEDEVDLAWWRTFQDATLDRLIQIAAERNLDVRLAAARLREARAARRAAAAEGSPQFDASIRGERFTSIERSNAESGNAAVVASWELDVFGRVREEARAAAADLRATDADLEATRLLLYAEITRAYLEHRLYQVQADLAQRNANTQEETVRITRARFEQGMSSRLDLERALATLRTTRAQVFPAREQAEAARLQLAFLTASTPEAFEAIIPSSPTQAPEIPRSDAPSALLSPMQVVENRPDVRAAQERLTAAVHVQQAARALRFPRITLSSVLGVSDRELGEWLNGGVRTWSAGAGILAPLIDFGRIRAAIEVSDARQEQAYLAYEATARRALRDAQTALVSYAEDRRREQELELAVQSARMAAQLARHQYIAGTLSLLEVLDAERSLYDVELRWSEATAEVALGLVTVYQSLGIGPRLPTSGPG